MTNIYHPLLALIASATNNELAKYVEYLKHENKILRARLPKQVHTTVEERQILVKFGTAIGRAIEELITISSPASFYRWVREAKNGKPAPKKPKGGQRKPKEIRELVLKIAEETGFGLTRIVGELRKLGITKISRQTVRNILKEAGIEPSPDRTSAFDIYEREVVAKQQWFPYLSGKLSPFSSPGEPRRCYTLESINMPARLRFRSVTTVAMSCSRGRCRRSRRRSMNSSRN